MIGQDRIQRFIQLRAQGWTFDRTDAECNVVTISGGFGEAALPGRAFSQKAPGHGLTTVRREKSKTGKKIVKFW